jgi:hypothetical protein
MPLSRSQFVKSVLRDGPRTLVAQGHLYMSGMVMATAVETLGGFLETDAGLETEMHRQGKSFNRFKRAIVDLFPTDYHKHVRNRKGLYEAWRCGLSHQSRTVGCALIGRQEASSMSLSHLAETGGVIVLVCEELLAHYVLACDELVKRYADGLLRDRAYLLTPGDFASIGSSTSGPISGFPGSGVYMS